MKNIRKLLLQEYPIDLSWKTQFKEVAYTGIFIVVFLFFFRPFEMKVVNGFELKFLFLCLLFGFITIVVCLLFNGLYYIFPAVFNEREWKVWKEIVATLVLIALLATANMIVANYFFNKPSLLTNFWRWQQVTFAIGLFPTVFNAFYKQSQLSNKYQTEGDHLNLQLQAHATDALASINSKLLTISGENQDERLQLNSADLLYITSTDNYVEIFYLENEQAAKVIFRSSLKRMEIMLAEFPEFFRCHRAYIVNLDQVKAVSGNAQGYKLHLQDTSIAIPVSRSLNDEIAHRFAKN